MTETKIPVDIFAVKKYGVDKWQKEFFWPVSDESFVKIYKGIEQCLLKQIDEQPEGISDLLIVQYALLFEYLYFLHALKVIDKIKEKGMNPLYSDNSLWYKNVVTDTFTDFNILKKGKPKYSHLKKIRIKITDFLRCLVYNIRFWKPFNFTSKKNILLVYGTVSSLMRQFIKRSPHSFHFTSRRDWLSGNAPYKIPVKLVDNIKKVSKIIADELRLVAGENDIGLSDNHVVYLQRLTENAMLGAAKMLHLVKTKINNKKITNLLASGFGDSFSRALFISARRKGCKVISFSHGGNVGLYDNPVLASSEFALSDEFITYTRKSSNLFEKIKNNHPPLKNNKVNIKSCDSDEFYKLWQKYGNKPLPKHIKRVMIIGCPHNQWRKPWVRGCFSFMHLDLELRIVDILKRAGYDVIYKAHPDRIKEVKGIFEDRAKVVTKGYFQDYMDMADAFLFGAIETTAFSVALCTNKPIIAFRIDEKYSEPFSEAMEVLKKRCRFIRTKFDEKNRIIFDEKELLDILAKEPKHPNNEFIKTYMFPESVKV